MTEKWKERVQDALHTVQTELKKTTDIGAKMLRASSTNSCLRQAYEELGKLAAEELVAQRVEFSHPQVESLLSRIKSCEESLTTIEEEVVEIKTKR